MPRRRWIESILDSRQAEIDRREATEEEIENRVYNGTNVRLSINDIEFEPTPMTDIVTPVWGFGTDALNLPRYNNRRGSYSRIDEYDSHIRDYSYDRYQELYLEEIEKLRAEVSTQMADLILGKFKEPEICFEF
ncbi:MAG: hypothetical protein RR744_00510 [Cellulosilyticaceae bacterium]